MCREFGDSPAQPFLTILGQFSGLLKNYAQKGVGVRPHPPPPLDPRLLNVFCTFHCQCHCQSKYYKWSRAMKPQCYCPTTALLGYSVMQSQPNSSICLLHKYEILPFDMQSQKAVSAYCTSKQILPFDMQSQKAVSAYCTSKQIPPSGHLLLFGTVGL